MSESTWRLLDKVAQAYAKGHRGFVLHHNYMAVVPQYRVDHD